MSHVGASTKYFAESHHKARKISKTDQRYDHWYEVLLLTQILYLCSQTYGIYLPPLIQVTTSEIYNLLFISLPVGFGDRSVLPHIVNSVLQPVLHIRPAPRSGILSYLRLL